VLHTIANMSSAAPTTVAYIQKFAADGLKEAEALASNAVSEGRNVKT